MTPSAPCANLWRSPGLARTLPSPPVPHTLQSIADHCGATLQGDGSRTVEGPASLAEALESEVSFLANPLYEPLLSSTRAAGVLVGKEVECSRQDLALLRVDDPNRAFTQVVDLFAEGERAPEPGVHPSSVVHESAELGPDVSVGPLCSVGRDAHIGAGSVLHAGVHVAEGVRVGAGCVLFPSVVLYAGVELGARCRIHAGTVIGSDGFGFEPTAEGWAKVPQCGGVWVGEDVEIGAGCTIDRARFGLTRIGDGVKVDNLVQVAHNCRIESAALLCAQVGISGSTTVGERAVLAGQAGVAGHIEIGAGAQIGGQAGVTGTVPPGASWTGWPARPVREALREVAYTRRVPELQRELKELRARLAKLEGGGQ